LYKGRHSDEQREEESQRSFGINVAEILRFAQNDVIKKVPGCPILCGILAKGGRPQLLTSPDAPSKHKRNQRVYMLPVIDVLRAEALQHELLFGL
jgi:hypothetical protein